MAQGQIAARRRFADTEALSNVACGSIRARAEHRGELFYLAAEHVGEQFIDALGASLAQTDLVFAPPRCPLECLFSTCVRPIAYQSFLIIHARDMFSHYSHARGIADKSGQSRKNPTATYNILGWNSLEPTATFL